MAITVVAAAAVYLFVYWVGGAVLMSSGAPDWVGSLLSIVVAVLVGWGVWLALRSGAGGLLRAAALGAVITGAIGFVLGFFGPIIVTPEANQGPLLGIFITGPIGFVLGAIGGSVRWWMRLRKRTTPN
jgi:hypothetical protein